MAKLPLTSKFVENAKSDRAIQTDYFDSSYPGLCLRVTDKGKKTWTYVFTAPDGKRARMTLGIFPALSLADAREAWKAVRNKCDEGIDPRTQEEQVVHKTVAQLIEERMQMEVRPQYHPKTGVMIRAGLRTGREVERRLAKDVTPVVGSIIAKDFRLSDLNKVLDPIRLRGAPRTVGQVYTDLRSVFEFGVHRGEIDFNPIAKAKIDKGWGVRNRYLSLEEIEIVWRLTPTVFARSQNVQRITKLCLALGQRLGEVAGMRRSELDMFKKTWTIPKDRVKNKHDHVVPLNRIAIRIIQDALAKTNGDILFEDRDSDGSLSSAAAGKTLFRAQRAKSGRELGAFGIPKWNMHDLRRTVSTQMLTKANGLGISRFEKGLVLNHLSATKENISDKHYDMNDYLDDKREALDKWGAFLERLVGENVVEIERAA